MERNTIQKEKIYGALCGLANHPTADEVYGAIRTECPSISRATVYRVLNKMAEKGDIRKVNVLNGADHYDHQTHPHYHIRCTRCGRVCDVDMPWVEGLEKQARSFSGFRVTGYSILFEGICPTCADKGGSINGQ